jgi:NitT/TauT family transport system substrate-binding protein
LGDPAVYKLSVKRSLEGLSPDGKMPAGGPQTALRVLTTFKPDLAKSNIDLSKTWTSVFVDKANQV